eukprot:TRINITY_DN297_c2_g1_i2.p2 TRINITY_DN297_c2_g1~~TRINITY_DN297_c2_g1_i2.p2  ORF type:complete len:304 (-),score=59.44 TRINITY_DN297_c2_g1_i2:633-1544(-)
MLQGPTNDCVFSQYNFSIATVSTFPFLTDNFFCCDYYTIRKKNSIFEVIFASGNENRKGSFDASMVVVTSVIDFLSFENKQYSLKTFSNTLIKAFDIAQNSLLKHKTDFRDIDTTSLCIAYCIPIGNQNIFISINVGSNRIFHFSKSFQTLKDIQFNENSISGETLGCIGPFIPSGKPDLRNLSLNICLCDKSDLFLICNTNTIDNFVPQDCATQPSTFGLCEKNWEEIHTNNQEIITLCEQQLQTIIRSTSNLHEMAESIKSQIFKNSQERKTPYSQNSKNNIETCDFELPSKANFILFEVI